eukprot:m.66136 g.66136  ORF g.66136 m.66136 type:complete len:105 (+) comp13715_c0_seq1:179-493(+)
MLHSMGSSTHAVAQLRQDIDVCLAYYEGAVKQLTESGYLGEQDGLLEKMGLRNRNKPVSKDIYEARSLLMQKAAARASSVQRQLIILKQHTRCDIMSELFSAAP